MKILKEIYREGRVEIKMIGVVFLTMALTLALVTAFGLLLGANSS